MSREREKRADGEESSGSRIGDLDRRDYLRTVGALGLTGAIGGLGAMTVASETADTSMSVDERIQDHRTGTLEVVVENGDGSTVSNADVTVEQQSHDFRWGTAVNADTLINQSSAGDNYREYITELFNTAVMENRHKWRFFETEQQLADQATDWLLEQGLEVRGHVCIWGDPNVSAIPDDVMDAIDNDDTQTIRERSMQHIEDIMDHYAGQIHEWEVVNEVQHATAIFDPFTSNPATSQIVADWYQHAQDVRPSGVTLGVNDYSVLAGNYDSDISTYQDHIQHLLDDGIDLHTTGLQCHFGQNETLDTNTVIDLLNQYGQLTDSIKITEYDQSGSGWSEDDKAEWFERFLRATFSHPGVDAFLIWGFWDGRHWEDDAPLFYDDWSTKPSYDVWADLVYGEWWTDETDTTDSSGMYATNAFLGDHEITVSTGSDSATTTASVTDSSGTTTVQVTVSGEGSGDPGDDLGGDPGGDPGDDPGDDLGDDPGDAPAWDSGEIYNAGDQVSYDGSVWEAQWWTQNEEPGAREYGPWEEVGDSGGSGDPGGNPSEGPSDDPGGNPGDDPGGDPDGNTGGISSWDPDEVYTEGDRVTHDGPTWEAQWWTQNQEPGTDQWGPWEEV